VFGCGLWETCSTIGVDGSESVLSILILAEFETLGKGGGGVDCAL